MVPNFSLQLIFVGGPSPQQKGEKGHLAGGPICVAKTTDNASSVAAIAWRATPKQSHKHPTGAVPGLAVWGVPCTLKKN